MDKLYLQNILMQNKRKTIRLNELTSYLRGDDTYDHLAKLILTLMDEGILRPIKSKGYNGRLINLPNAYSISKEKILSDFKNELQRELLKYSSKLDLDYYFKHEREIYFRDKPYLVMVDKYINEVELPLSKATIPERSYMISGDEKWLSDKGGLDLLDRISIRQDMNLIMEVEPIAYALNPNYMCYDTYKHLIVENKSIYYSILKIFHRTSFASLVYGAGWRVVSSIHSFHKQFPFKNKKHEFYYFGDLDHEGIKIWDSLNTYINAMPEISLYHELMKASPSKGKTHQACDENALTRFLDLCDLSGVKELLSAGMYLPQEALSLERLSKILGVYDD